MSNIDLRGDGTPRNPDRPYRDPETVARVVNLAWSAGQDLRRYRARQLRQMPQLPDRAAETLGHIADLERRCEALEAALYALGAELRDVELTAEYALERTEAA